MSQDRPTDRSRVRSPSSIREVDQVCDAFEQQWMIGERPDVSTYLERVRAPLRAELLRELVVVEVMYRRRAGQEVTLAEYQQRFPDDAEVLQAAERLLRSWCDQDTEVRHADRPAEAPEVPLPSEPDTVGHAVSHTTPTQFGRYQIKAVLGSGGFGTVYRAMDPQLQRAVALKVPHRSWISSAQQCEMYLHEAHVAAQLKHPGLVAVYDVQQEGDSVYIVQEFVDGLDLGCWAASVELDPARIVRLMIEIVEAVGFAHQQGLVHRDLKPANILVDQRGHAHVADFGLALDESLQQFKQGETCGTPAYMSPEQVRGETHRLDGRSDLWSLGVILYELLAGRRPFQGDSSTTMFDEIQHRDPKPPRMVRPEIPAELERIALKCLTKRATDRYGSAAELVEDLQAWLTRTAEPARAENVESGTATQPSRIVPKGLRSFDAQDADFFLELLPGPRDREGLPESVRFWKSRIEERDADATFAVGVMYGPSGCGKSSLVKAGLLPHLPAHVLPIFVEATPADTELRLLKALHKHVPRLAVEASLAEVLAQLREGRVTEGRKVLLVLDQFEQWLHAVAHLDSSQLVRALRQCDGGHVQCLILARDDFWLSTTRFMQALEIPQLEGINSAVVDLFDPTHARKVLCAFGLAYGRLPEHELSADEQRFLDRAVQDLTHDGKVICVQLSLFADMMKGRPWTPASLREVGGTSGVGVAFLDETFTAKTSPPTHRLHAKAAQAVLKALLPAAGTDIKGQMQPAEHLLECSGYAARPDDFRNLLQILNRELRLITPTEHEEAEGGATELTSTKACHVFYQLTHDYLVPSLREWLTRKQKETRRGRAVLLLTERSALWNTKPENRHLPSLFEYVNIRILTVRKSWSELQLAMMRRARRVHGWRVLSAVLLALLAAWGSFEVHGRWQTLSLLKADPVNLPDALDRLSPSQLWAQHHLRQVVERTPQNDAERREQFHARLAYATLTGTYDAQLLAGLFDCSIPYFGIVRDVLQPQRQELAATLWTTLHDLGEPPERRFRAGLALTTFATESPFWSADDYALLAAQLLKENPIHQPQLWQDLRPLAPRLIPALEQLFAQKGLPESQQIGAANALTEFASTDHARLARLLSQANALQYPVLYPLVSRCPDETAKAVLAEMAAEQPADDLSQQDRVVLGRRRAGAAISLLRLGETNKCCAAFPDHDDPESVMQFVHRCRERGVTASQLVESLQKTSDVPSRYAMLSSLGNFPPDALGTTQHDELIRQLTAMYRSDPSSAIHGVTGWLLRKWGHEEEAIGVDHTPLPYDSTGKREWYVVAVPLGTRNKPGLPTDVDKEMPNTVQELFFTFVVFPPGEYLMGSPESEVDRQADEQLHRVSLTRPIAVSSHETTWSQYNPMDGGQTQGALEQELTRKLGPEEPVSGVSWFQAVRYCRWLTERLGMSESDQCYDDEATLPQDAEGNPEQWPVHLDRPGCRLLTEAEWECVCRGGMRTAFCFGNDPQLLPHYGWFMDNSEKWSHSVGQLRPSLRGLFDVHGNVYEWCHDWYRADVTDGVTDPAGAESGSFRVFRGGAWYVSAFCRTAVRLRDRPVFRSIDLGFRVAVTPVCESGK